MPALILGSWAVVSVVGANPPRPKLVATLLVERVANLCGAGGGIAKLTVFNIVPDESNNIVQSDPFISPYLTAGYDTSGS
jgi:hypothetical protein